MVDASERSPTVEIFEDGILAGMLGAVVVAVVYLLLDVLVRGEPFFTPSLLGTAFFAGEDDVRAVHVSGAMVFAYTGLHGVLFLIAGEALAWLFFQIESNPQIGLVLTLLFLLFETILFSFVAGVFPNAVGALGAWTILLANLASVGAMFAYLLRRHPTAIDHLRAAWQE